MGPRAASPLLLKKETPLGEEHAMAGVERKTSAGAESLIARAAAKALKAALVGALAALSVQLLMVAARYLGAGGPAAQRLADVAEAASLALMACAGLAFVVALAARMRARAAVFRPHIVPFPAPAEHNNASEPAFSGPGARDPSLVEIKKSYGEHGRTVEKPEELLQSNKAWARARLKEDPEFFNRLSKVQRPQFLWIGCSDSRVPANQIVDLEPGQMFVHRNIANVVPHSDPNCLAVIQYAVEYLGVKHIVVVGHYGCGGVRAAMSQVDHGQIDNWLAHIKDVYSRYYEEISALDDPEEQLDRLCELNVTVQVRNVAKTSIVQHAWRSGRKLSVHGWIYDLKDGILRDLGTTLSAIEDLHVPYRILK